MVVDDDPRFAKGLALVIGVGVCVAAAPTLVSSRLSGPQARGNEPRMVNKIERAIARRDESMQKNRERDIRTPLLDQSLLAQPNS